jgi:hypothetical protein
MAVLQPKPFLNYRELSREEKHQPGKSECDSQKAEEYEDSVTYSFLEGLLGCQCENNRYGEGENGNGTNVGNFHLLLSPNRNVVDIERN